MAYKTKTGEIKADVADFINSYVDKEEKKAEKKAKAPKKKK